MLSDFVDFRGLLPLSGVKVGKNRKNDSQMDKKTRNPKKARFLTYISVHSFTLSHLKISRHAGRPPEGHLKLGKTTLSKAVLTAKFLKFRGGVLRSRKKALFQ